MNKVTKTIISIIAVGVLVVCAYIIGKDSPQLSIGSAPPGLASLVATSSSVDVSATAATLFGESLMNCSARIVSTDGNAILLAFEGTTTYAGSGNSGYGISSTTVTSGREGHVQAASTTVVYDAALYGCGAVTAVTATAGAGVVTVTELR